MIKIACVLFTGLTAFTGFTGFTAFRASPPQSPPSTELFLSAITVSAGTTMLGAPKNISNNPGYDNQPSFLPDSSAVLFTSNRDGKQTDIYSYNVKSSALTQLTHTAENEYSALVAPDKKSFLAVHGDEQSIFRYDLDGSNPRLAYQHGKALIGYHVWVSETEVAAFVLGANGSPNNLEFINTADGSSVVIESNIGRSLLRRPNHNTISFISKSDRAKWQIKQFNVTSEAVSDIADTLPGVEDMTWLPDGRIVMGQGSKLFVWREGSTWQPLADLSAQGVTKITRVAASPDGKFLAIVGEPGAVAR